MAVITRFRKIFSKKNKSNEMPDQGDSKYLTILERFKKFIDSNEFANQTQYLKEVALKQYFKEKKVQPDQQYKLLKEVAIYAIEKEMSPVFNDVANMKFDVKKYGATSGEKVRSAIKKSKDSANDTYRAFKALVDENNRDDFKSLNDYIYQSASPDLVNQEKNKKTIALYKDFEKLRSKLNTQGKSEKKRGWFK